MFVSLMTFYICSHDSWDQSGKQMLLQDQKSIPGEINEQTDVGYVRYKPWICDVRMMQLFLHVQKYFRD